MLEENVISLLYYLTLLVIGLAFLRGGARLIAFVAGRFVEGHTDRSRVFYRAYVLIGIVNIIVAALSLWLVDRRLVRLSLIFFFLALLYGVDMFVHRESERRYSEQERVE